MAQDRFIIAPFTKGLQEDLRPWLIADDAFEELSNAYVFRGRVRKRFGTQLMNSDKSAAVAPLYSRLRVKIAKTGVNLGNTDGAGDITGNTAGPFVIGQKAIGQKFEIAGEVFTVVVEGTPGVMTTTGAATTHTYDTTNGAYDIKGAAAVQATFFAKDGSLGGVTDGSGDAVGIVPGNKFNPGQAFSIGDEIFTVQSLGTPIDMLTTGASTIKNFNTTTGAFEFADAALNTDIYFYPAEPVMGITNYEKATINDEWTYAFDTQFAYVFDGVAWERLGTAVWTGTNSEFFWATNYRGDNDYDNFLFVSNFKTSEMKYWDGGTWTNFIPQYITTGQTIKTARLIIPFKDRLLLLNTVEKQVVGGADERFQNRCRYSRNGNPAAVSSFHQDDPKNGGDHVDAPTREAIISAKILKDRLIVFFERSTWELVYTNNQAEPFVWQQLNIELGCESTFSVVPFDTVVLGVGNVGIHACNGLNVERIDQSIPDRVFNIHNKNDGVFRVHGIRDYFAELVYWTFPSQGNATYPNKVLVFNYKNRAWATNDDTFTAFGYYQNQTDITWNLSAKTWQESIEIWDSGVLEAKFRQVIAGNQQGFVFVVSTKTSRNAPALQITDIAVAADLITVTMTLENHNLSDQDFVLIENAQGITSLNGKIYPIHSIVNVNTIKIVEDEEGATITGTYTGGGTIARVSRIDIRTKQYNFYVKQAKNAFISKVDFYLDKTVKGQITVDSFPSASEVSLLDAGTGNNSIVGTNILETSPYLTIPLEEAQARVWHPIYLQSEGEVVQLRLYLSDTQLRDPEITKSDFKLHSMVFYAQPVGRLQ